MTLKLGAEGCFSSTQGIYVEINAAACGSMPKLKMRIKISIYLLFFMALLIFLNHIAELEYNTSNERKQQGNLIALVGNRNTDGSG